MIVLTTSTRRFGDGEENDGVWSWEDIDVCLIVCCVSVFLERHSKTKFRNTIVVGCLYNCFAVDYGLYWGEK